MDKAEVLSHIERATRCCRVAKACLDDLLHEGMDIYAHSLSSDRYRERVELLIHKAKILTSDLRALHNAVDG